MVVSDDKKSYFQAQNQRFLGPVMLRQPTQVVLSICRCNQLEVVCLGGGKGTRSSSCRHWLEISAILEKPISD